MKILIVTGIFPPDAGGPANYVPAIADALSERHEVLAVVTLSDSLDHADRRAYPVIRLARGQNRIARRWRTILAIRRLAHAADVVYLNGLVLEGVIAARVLRRRPVVVKVVGDLIWEQARNGGVTTLSIDEFQRAGGMPAKIRALRWLQGLYTSAAQKVITPSRYLGSLVEGWGVPAGKLAVVFNAVQPPAPAPATRPEFDVVTAARLVPWKGIDRLIAVCGALGRSLLVIGDGPIRGDLERQAKAEGAKVTFVGQVPRHEVAQQMRRARLFVLNSTYEGLPHIVLEAKLAGLPVVATAVGGTPETIHDGIDGLLVEVDSDQQLRAAISDLLSNEDRRAMIAEAGLRDAQRRFSFETMLVETERVLAEAAAS